MHKVKKRIAYAAAVLSTLASTTAAAVNITADYSQLGTVYQLSNGQLSNTMGAGAIDVTDIFKSNVSTAINYWQNAVSLPWSTTYTFQLAALDGAVGDNQITKFDANGRSMNSILRVDSWNAGNPNDGNAIAFFMDTTPADNSEFGAIKSTTALLGGGNVNVGRIGTATSGSASQGYDFLSLVLHEMEHGLGFTTSSPRWNNVVNGAGDTLTVSSELSGLPSSFAVPVTGSHIDGTAAGGRFNDTSIALPGFERGQRALLSDVDIYSICAVEGCTASQVNTNPSPIASPVPEPSTTGMLAAGLAVVFYARRRAKARS